MILAIKITSITNGKLRKSVLFYLCKKNIKNKNPTKRLILKINPKSKDI